MKQSKDKISLKCNLQKYSLEDIRYAAYSVSDKAYVLLKKSNLKTVEVSFKRKNGNSVQKTVKLFKEEVENEKIRAGIFKDNVELRAHLILQALNYEDKPETQTDDVGLTPEQEKELDDLISQVEKELKEESEGRKNRDPLGINKTWEEKNAGKIKSKKK